MSHTYGTIDTYLVEHGNQRRQCAFFTGAFDQLQPRRAAVVGERVPGVETRATKEPISHRPNAARKPQRLRNVARMHVEHLDAFLVDKEQGTISCTTDAAANVPFKPHAIDDDIVVADSQQ